jgi:esterase/lipase
VYIIQSTHDYVAHPVSAQEIYNEIGSKEKRIKWYQETTHFMPNEECIDDIVYDSLNWANVNLNIM